MLNKINCNALISNGIVRPRKCVLDYRLCVMSVEDTGWECVYWRDKP